MWLMFVALKLANLGSSKLHSAVQLLLVSTNTIIDSWDKICCKK